MVRGYKARVWFGFDRIISTGWGFLYVEENPFCGNDCFEVNE